MLNFIKRGKQLGNAMPSNVSTHYMRLEQYLRLNLPIGYTKGRKSILNGKINADEQQPAQVLLCLRKERK